MSGLTLNIGPEETKKIASCIKELTGKVSENDIIEIVLRPAEEKAKEDSRPEVVMNSREVADLLGRPHTTVIKQIARYICSVKKDDKARGFRLTSFVCSHKNKKSYPMYEMTEDACKEYRSLVEKYGKGIQSVSDGLKRFDQAVQERFHPETAAGRGTISNSGFLLEGKPQSDYAPYCEMFDRFITGPASEGREIPELTEKYQQFYKVMKEIQMRAQDSNKLECALYGVAIEAEMQGFIYGIKLFDALLCKQLSVA